MHNNKATLFRKGRIPATLIMNVYAIHLALAKATWTGSNQGIMLALILHSCGQSNRKLQQLACRKSNTCAGTRWLEIKIYESRPS